MTEKQEPRHINELRALNSYDDLTDKEVKELMADERVKARLLFEQEYLSRVSAFEKEVQEKLSEMNRKMSATVKELADEKALENMRATLELIERTGNGE